MTTIASRELRNHTAEVLRQVAEGTPVTVTVHGEPVAEIHPARARRPFFRRADLIATLRTRQADPGLAAVLQELAGNTTDELGAP
jgi:prevent-host-death family protein